jgi:hypothetical protein
VTTVQIEMSTTDLNPLIFYTTNSLSGVSELMRIFRPTDMGHACKNQLLAIFPDQAGKDRQCFILLLNVNSELKKTQHCQPLSSISSILNHREQNKIAR